MEPLRLTPQRAPRKGRRGKGKKPFDIPAALQRADAVMAGPHFGIAPRVPGKGNLVHRFVLPLELCKTTNSLISMLVGGSRMPPRPGQRQFTGAAQMAALEKKIWDMMYLQHPFVRADPLPGRPMLRIVRFSSKEHDEAADGTKLARDLLRRPIPPKWDEKKRELKPGRKGFGFLVDDAQQFVETVRFWEKVSPGNGLGLIEIWSGQ